MFHEFSDELKFDHRPFFPFTLNTRSEEDENGNMTNVILTLKPDRGEHKRLHCVTQNTLSADDNRLLANWHDNILKEENSFELPGSRKVVYCLPETNTDFFILTLEANAIYLIIEMDSGELTILKTEKLISEGITDNIDAICENLLRVSKSVVANDKRLNLKGLTLYRLKRNLNLIAPIDLELQYAELMEGGSLNQYLLDTITDGIPHNPKADYPEHRPSETSIRKKVEALAAGHSEELIVTIYVFLMIDKKLGVTTRNEDEIFWSREKYLWEITRAEYKLIEEKLEDAIQDDYVNKYLEKSFLKRSLEERFDISFSTIMELWIGSDLGDLSQYAFGISKAWFQPEEYDTLYEHANKVWTDRMEINYNAVAVAKPEWLDPSWAKSYLQIRISEKEGDGSDISHNCSNFQVQVGSTMVSVRLTSELSFSLQLLVSNMFLYFWASPSILNVWEAAMENDIVDERAGALDTANVLNKAIEIVSQMDLLNAELFSSLDKNATSNNGNSFRLNRDIIMSKVAKAEVHKFSSTSNEVEFRIPFPVFFENRVDEEGGEECWIKTGYKRTTTNDDGEEETSYDNTYFVYIIPLPNEKKNRDLEGKLENSYIQINPITGKAENYYRLPGRRPVAFHTMFVEGKHTVQIEGKQIRPVSLYLYFESNSKKLYCLNYRSILIGEISNEFDLMIENILRISGFIYVNGEPLNLEEITAEKLRREIKLGYEE